MYLIPVFWKKSRFQLKKKRKEKDLHLNTKYLIVKIFSSQLLLTQFFHNICLHWTKIIHCRVSRTHSHFYFHINSTRAVIVNLGEVSPSSPTQRHAQYTPRNSWETWLGWSLTISSAHSFHNQHPKHWFHSSPMKCLSIKNIVSILICISQFSTTNGYYCFKQNICKVVFKINNTNPLCLYWRERW